MSLYPASALLTSAELHPHRTQCPPRQSISSKSLWPRWPNVLSTSPSPRCPALCSCRPLSSLPSFALPSSVSAASSPPLDRLSSRASAPFECPPAPVLLRLRPTVESSPTPSSAVASVCWDVRLPNLSVLHRVVVSYEASAAVSMQLLVCTEEDAEHSSMPCIMSNTHVIGLPAHPVRCSRLRLRVSVEPRLADLGTHCDERIRHTPQYNDQTEGCAAIDQTHSCSACPTNAEHANGVSGTRSDVDDDTVWLLVKAVSLCAAPYEAPRHDPPLHSCSPGAIHIQSVGHTDDNVERTDIDSTGTDDHTASTDNTAKTAGSDLQGVCCINLPVWQPAWPSSHQACTGSSDEQCPHGNTKPTPNPSVCRACQRLLSCPGGCLQSSLNNTPRPSNPDCPTKPAHVPTSALHGCIQQTRAVAQRRRPAGKDGSAGIPLVSQAPSLPPPPDPVPVKMTEQATAEPSPPDITAAASPAQATQGIASSTLDLCRVTLPVASDLETLLSSLWELPADYALESSLASSTSSSRPACLPVLSALSSGESLGECVHGTRDPRSPLELPARARPNKQVLASYQRTFARSQEHQDQHQRTFARSQEHQDQQQQAEQGFVCESGLWCCWLWSTGVVGSAGVQTSTWLVVRHSPNNRLHVSLRTSPSTHTHVKQQHVRVVHQMPDQSFGIVFLAHL